MESTDSLNFGTAAAGYQIEVDRVTRTVRVRAWGFWDVELATSFGSRVQSACTQNRGTQELIVDMTELKPMRDEGQHGLADLIAALPALKVEAATFTVSSQLTKLQLMRIVNSNDRTRCARILEGSAGSAWTR